MKKMYYKKSQHFTIFLASERRRSKTILSFILLASRSNITILDIGEQSRHTGQRIVLQSPNSTTLRTHILQ